MDTSFNNVNAPAYQYQVAVAEQFTSICEPLFKLGIKYFLYCKAFQNGKYLLFINSLSYIKAHLETIKEPGEFFTLTNYMKGRSTYSTISSSCVRFYNKKEPILQLAFDFNMGNMFFINKLSSNDARIIFGFVGDHNDEYMVNFCINNLMLLEHFCDYFEQNAEDLVDCKDLSKLADNGIKNLLNQTANEEILTQKVEEFLLETQVKRTILRAKGREIPISKREVECLNYLSLGQSSKQIARTLSLSPRTIDFYIDRIKKKSGYYSRADLIREYSKNSLLLN